MTLHCTAARAIGMVAGEPSGDLLAGRVIAGLHQRFPGVAIEGIGGPRMREQGFEAWHDMHALTVFGFVDALKRLPSLLSIYNDTKKRLLNEPPAVFVGIDAPDFNLRLERELRQAIKSKVKNQVMEGLVAANPIEVPKALIGNEVNRLRVQAVQQFGGNIKPEQLPAELFEEQAKRRVVLGLIVAELVKQHELKADEARVREMIEEMASAYQEPEQVVAWYYKNDQQLNEVRSVVLEEQVVDTVLQKAKVTDKQVSYEDAVKPAEAPVAA